MSAGSNPAKIKASCITSSSVASADESLSRQPVGLKNWWLPAFMVIACKTIYSKGANSNYIDHIFWVNINSIVAPCFKGRLCFKRNG